MPPLVQVTLEIAPLLSVITVNSAPVPLTGATLVWVTPVVVVLAVKAFETDSLIVPTELILP